MRKYRIVNPMLAPHHEPDPLDINEIAQRLRFYAMDTGNLDTLEARKDGVYFHNVRVAVPYQPAAPAPSPLTIRDAENYAHLMIGARLAQTSDYHGIGIGGIPNGIAPHAEHLAELLIEGDFWQAERYRNSLETLYDEETDILYLETKNPA